MDSGAGARRGPSRQSLPLAGGEQAKVGVRPDIMLVWVIAFGGAGLLVPCVARGCDTCPPRPYPRPIGLFINPGGGGGL